MAKFLISYDLHNSRNYTPLWARLGEWRAVRALESLWLADLNGTASAVRDNLQSLVDGDDSIFVVELHANGSWATLRVPDTAVQWMKGHILV